MRGCMVVRASSVWGLRRCARMREAQISDRLHCPCAVHCVSLESTRCIAFTVRLPTRHAFL